VYCIQNDRQIPEASNSYHIQHHAELRSYIHQLDFLDYYKSSNLLVVYQTKLSVIQITLHRMTMNNMLECMWNKAVIGTLICSLHFPARVQRNHTSPQLGYMMWQLRYKQVPFSSKSQALQHKPPFSVQTVNLRDGYKFGSITVKFF